MQYIDKYPEQPSQLPPDVYKAVYQQSPPEAKFIHRYESLASHVPLRKSSRLLQQPETTQSVQLALPGPSHAQPHQLMYGWYGQSPWQSSPSWGHNNWWDDSYHYRNQKKPKLAICDREPSHDAICDGEAGQASSPAAEVATQSSADLDASPRSNLSTSPALKQFMPIPREVDPPDQAEKVNEVVQDDPQPRRSSADIEEEAFVILCRLTAALRL